MDQPEKYVTRTVIEGEVTRSSTGKLQIEGHVDQDDLRLGYEWPDKIIRLETTISAELHLACYEGDTVRVTIERL